MWGRRVGPAFGSMIWIALMLSKRLKPSPWMSWPLLISPEAARSMPSKGTHVPSAADIWPGRRAAPSSLSHAMFRQAFARVCRERHKTRAVGQVEAQNNPKPT